MLSAWELRALHADGANYLLHMLETGDFAFFEPARAAVHFLQQFLVVGALKAGVDDISALTVLYGLAMQWVPVVLTAVCYVIAPAGDKRFTVFPLINFLAGALAAMFSAVTENPVAVAYFWPVFFLILFRCGRTGALLLTLIAAIPLVVMGEAQAVLGPLLLVAAVWRAVHERSPLRRWLLWLLSGWIVVVMLIQVGHIVDPRAPENRDGLLQDLLAFRWLVNGDREFNTPALLGLLAIAAFPLLWLAGRIEVRAVRASVVASIVLGFTVTALWAVLAPVVTDHLVDPAMQFRGRYHSVFVTLLLGVVLLASLIYPQVTRAWSLRVNLVIVGVLGIGSLGWHAAGIHQWSRYIDDYRSMLTTQRGLVPWNTALDTLAPHAKRRFQKMSWVWTNPTMSIVLAPRGKAVAIVDNPDHIGWEPFDPSDPESLPNGGLIDTRKLRATIEK